MIIYLTVPGMKKQPVLVPGNATLADFCRKAFELTGIRLFNGFGYKSQDGSTYLPKEAVISRQNAVATSRALAAPTIAILSSSSGGSLAATSYFVKVTYVDVNGNETLPSPEATQANLINTLVNVASPGASTNATGYNVYVSNTAGGGSGAETKQNTTPIAIATPWVEPTSGLIAGAAVPTVGTAFDQITPVDLSAAAYTAALSSLFTDGDNLIIYGGALGVPLGG